MASAPRPLDRNLPGSHGSGVVRVAVISICLAAAGVAEPVAEPDLATAELIARLADDNFTVRENAQCELVRRLHLAPGGEPNALEALCYETWRTTGDPEIRARARAVLEEFATRMWSPTGFLGIAMSPDHAFDESGKRVARLRAVKVQAGSPAARAGIAKDDFILGFDGSPFAGGDPKSALGARLAATAAGESLTISLVHAGRSRESSVVLGFKLPSAQKAPDGREIPPDPEARLRKYLAAKQTRAHPTSP